MKYKFCNNKLKLVKYICTATDIHNEQIIYLATENSEKNNFVTIFPQANIEEVDNNGYEWLDGMEFTNKQRLDGEPIKAIALGKDAYNEYALAINRDAQILDLDYRLSLIELGLGGE